jgi:hypothetical protein
MYNFSHPYTIYRMRRFGITVAISWQQSKKAYNCQEQGEKEETERYTKRPLQSHSHSKTAYKR